MTEKLKRELEKTEYQRTNVTPILILVSVIIVFSIFFFVSPHEDKPLDSETRGNTQTTGIKRRELVAPVTGWTKPTRVYSGDCSSASVEEHGLPDFVIEAATLAKPNDWFVWSANTAKPAAWRRYRSLGPGPTKVIEEVGPCAQ